MPGFRSWEERTSERKNEKEKETEKDRERERERAREITRTNGIHMGGRAQSDAHLCASHVKPLVILMADTQFPTVAAPCSLSPENIILATN